jgi:hypothetical protein
MDGACNTYGEGTNVYRVLMGSMKLENPKCRWEDLIKILKAKFVYSS